MRFSARLIAFIAAGAVAVALAAATLLGSGSTVAHADAKCAAKCNSDFDQCMKSNDRNKCDLERNQCLKTCYGG